MAELKTFLFTDIVGSVELKRQMPGHSDAERDQAFIEHVLMPHRERIERDLLSLGGRIVSTAGDGHFLVFADTVLAARWAVGIQQIHRDDPVRTPSGQIVVRISIHLGIPQIDPHDPANFVGKPVDYAARLCDYATGGQVLVSRSVVAVLEDAGMDGVSFHRHGQRDLKGIGQVEIYELVYEPAGPRKMRPQPRETLSRQWTVLPATVGLTEYRGNVARGADGDRWPAVEQAPVVPQTPSDVAPTRLGNYEIEARLGSGGMGDVYRARHIQFGRKRAVKVIRQHFVDSGHREVIRRFYQEIKAVGALEHPNIVVAIDSSAPTDSVHYLVMEYIDGIGADALVGQQGPLPVADACEIARQAARGLAYIQQHGMVHRDIKPSNLMLTVVRAEEFGSGGSSTPAGATEDQAVVKILDLGLALLVGDDQQRLTMMDNRAMGTAMYMSPEQWKTTSVDIRADIYSLGCTLYHLLAGKPPFWESDLRPEKAHEREKLPPIRVDDPLPRPLWDILQKMTAKNPDDRFADPAEVAAALAPFAEGHHLPRLARQAMKRAQPGFTQSFGSGETEVAKSGSDTRLGRKPTSWGLSKSPLSRRVIWRAVMAASLLAAVATLGWLVVLATGSRESKQRALESQLSGLQTAASFASNQILDQIKLRFDMLTRLAADEELRRLMVAIDQVPGDESQWAELEKLLGKIKADTDQEAPADSWFINDVRGVQVARSPSSSASRGDNYSHRDYFHGGGADLPEGTPGLTPIKRPHLSAVYRSTTTSLLKVAFSAPIENGRSGDDRKIVGVLAMSVDLGEFNVLENDLPRGQEVVLIDLRPTSLEGAPAHRGLILHHRARLPLGRDQPALWVGSEVMARIDELLAAAKAADSRGSIRLPQYRDPDLTRNELYWGAIKPVVEQRPDGEVFETAWLVLVQEPASR
jgi:serine/threonine protein kinase/class 3 adenylate cyclase